MTRARGDRQTLKRTNKQALQRSDAFPNHSTVQPQISVHRFEKPNYGYARQLTAGLAGANNGVSKQKL